MLDRIQVLNTAKLYRQNKLHTCNEFKDNRFKTKKHDFHILKVKKLFRKKYIPTY